MAPIRMITTPVTPPITTIVIPPITMVTTMVTTVTTTRGMVLQINMGTMRRERSPVTTCEAWLLPRRDRRNSRRRNGGRYRTVRGGPRPERDRNDHRSGASIARISARSELLTNLELLCSEGPTQKRGATISS